MTQTTNKVLDQGLAELPREQQPRRDLWGAIAAEIESSRQVRGSRGRIAFGAAAGFVIGATFFWLAMGSRSMSAGHVAPLESQTLIAIRSSQHNAYRERLPLLDAKTRARVERDLAVIQAAEADLANALKSEPDSAVLSRLYESTVRQEFDLYDTIVRATEPVITRTTT